METEEGENAVREIAVCYAVAVVHSLPVPARRKVRIGISKMVMVPVCDGAKMPALSLIRPSEGIQRL